MKKLIYLISFLVLSSCASKDVSVKDDQRTVQKLVVAVKTEGSSTVISSGRLDTWYRINIPLTEGMIYEMTMEVPRVVRDPVIIPADIIDYTPVEFLQRDLFGRYLTKYSELKSADRELQEESSE